MFVWGLHVKQPLLWISEFLFFFFLPIFQIMWRTLHCLAAELFQLKQSCLELCSHLSVKTTLPLEMIDKKKRGKMIDKKENDREILSSPNLQHSNN